MVLFFKKGSLPGLAVLSGNQGAFLTRFPNSVFRTAQNFLNVKKRINDFRWSFAGAKVLHETARAAD